MRHKVLLGWGAHQPPPLGLALITLLTLDLVDVGMDIGIPLQARSLSLPVIGKTPVELFQPLAMRMHYKRI